MDEIKAHSGITDSRVLAYLNMLDRPAYINTEEENALLQLWRAKYYIAKAEYEKSRANSTKVKMWRDAYEGTFYKLDDEGNVTEVKMKPIRKLAYELVAGKKNAKIPTPKMSPRHHADILPVNTTEKLIRHEMDKMLSEQVNEESENNVCIDGTSWFKVDWNPFDNTHERSGNPMVSVCPVDTIFPQPGIKYYKQLEYIFELSTITVSQCLDLYNRVVHSPTGNDIIPIVNCYFLNEHRYVGKFTWCEETHQVLCNDVEWGIRKRRECVDCHAVQPMQDVCEVCGSKKFKYVSVKDETLQEPLTFVTNPYRTGSTPDRQEDQVVEDTMKSIPAGTKIPHYLVRQLPFVPYIRISAPNSIYGMSEVELILEDQDLINKFLLKAEKKSAKSKAVVTKLKDTNIDNDDAEIAYVEVESPQEGQAIQTKQIMSDISQEFSHAGMLYELAKSTVGITDTDQGKNDPSARSGKAKQLQMAASAQRNYAPDKMRNLAFSGVYELLFKYLLAYCDEERAFVTLLPDGTEMEQVWSKYMFLARDDYGEFYYRDDFAWSVDDATEITQDRAAMWQLIDNDYINGTMGNQVDPIRALKMFWQMKEQYGYPTAKYALAFLKETEKSLPSQVERVLVENPEAVELALSFIRDRQVAAGLAANGASGTGQKGGARPNAGKPGNGASHSANVEKTNNKNRAQSGSGQTTTHASSLGGMQGGTNNSSKPAEIL
jgi:predicted  nucleic acid-binding Zn-ribbon protein